MDRINKQIVLYSIILLFFFKSSYAINCYQCSGTDPLHPFQCNEWLDSDIDLEPKSCDDVYDAKYCIKHTGRFEASGINCYQCSSGQTIDCSDGMIHMGALEPQNCDKVFEAQYCIKSTGLDGGIGAKRFCSSLDLGNYCNYVRQPGDTLESYRTCIFTCRGDGCNPATSIKPTCLVLLSILFSIFYRLR